MFNINYFETFAKANRLPLGPDFGKPAVVAAHTPAAFSHVLEAISEGAGGLPERGDFPEDALPPVMLQYARELAAMHQVPVELPALCMISAVSGCLGKSWEAAGCSADWRTRGNFYTVLSLPPGSGKSVANRIVRPILKAEHTREDVWRKVSDPALRSEQEALESEIKRIKNPKKGEAIKRAELERKVTELEDCKRRLNYSPALTIGNATTSGLAAELARVDSETLFVFAPEGGEVVRVMLGAYRKEGTDMDLWLVGYSGEGYKQTRAGSGNSQSIKEACLSALLMVQPCVLQEVISNKHARERGLLTRVFPVQIEVEVPFDDGVVRTVNPCTESRWENLLTQILEKRFNLSAAVTLECSEEVKGIFRDFHNQTSCQWARGALADYRGELSRWRENAIRLAVVLQVATDPNARAISPEVARNAVRIFRYIGTGALELLSTGRFEKLKERREQLEKVLKANNGECMSSDLLKRHAFSKDEQYQLAAAFPSHFLIEEKPATQAGGRPGKVVKLLTPRQQPPASLN